MLEIVLLRSHDQTDHIHNGVHFFKIPNTRAPQNRTLNQYSMWIIKKKPNEFFNTRHLVIGAFLNTSSFTHIHSRTSSWHAGVFGYWALFGGGMFTLRRVAVIFFITAIIHTAWDRYLQEDKVITLWNHSAEGPHMACGILYSTQKPIQSSNCIARTRRSNGLDYSVFNMEPLRGYRKKLYSSCR
jgi:hypothetical protein